MKKIILLAVLIASTSSFAAYGPAGCGFGTMLFKDKQGLAFNVLAATFNGSSANQTFGMSFGTLGCDVNEGTTVSQLNFIEANKVALANDIARGQGEALATLASLYKCSNVQKMGVSLKSNYKAIFSDYEAKAIHNKIGEVMTNEQACI